MNENFTGDTKKLNNLLLKMDRKILNFFLPLVPKKISTIHLTLSSFLWCVLVLVFGYFANKNIYWLFGFNVCLCLQYITDMLDGEVGRKRNEGFIKWGFYMDHYLDYIFLCATIIGYFFLLPISYFPLIILSLVIYSGFMIHAFLDFAITRDFKITFIGFGPSEMRWFLILMNFLLLIEGKALFIKIFPFLVALSLIGLCSLIYKSQKNYKLMDHEARTRIQE